MTDLVKRLRDCEFMGMPDARLDYSTATEAADRIEALEAQIAAADKLVEACESAFDGINVTGPQEFYAALAAYEDVKEVNDE